jgi:hypothetical protein
MVDNLGQGKVGRVDIEIALDHLQVRGDLAKKVIGLAVGQVTETKGLADLAGSEELAELCEVRGISM